MDNSEPPADPSSRGSRRRPALAVDLADANYKLTLYTARIGVLERENKQLREWAESLTIRIHQLETRE